MIPSTTTFDTTTSRATVIHAPDRDTQISGPSVFLAGSIDMGNAVDWQKDTTNALERLPVTILNPRRLEWDSTWEQDINFAPFREQVNWEMDMLDCANVIMLFFSGNSKAPISLLELGLYAGSKKIVVGCEPHFYRRGNVQIVCDRYDIQLEDSFEALLAATQRKLMTLIKEKPT